MYSLFQKAHLTTGERTILSLFLTALITGGFTVGDLIARHGSVNWSTVAYVGIGAVFVSFGHSLATFLSTNGYAPLGSMVEQDTKQVEKQVDSKIDPALPTRQFIAMPPSIPGTQRVNPIILPPAPPSSQETIPEVPVVPPPPPEQQ